MNYTVSHPAPFSASIMDVLAELIRDWEGPILDPYAGIGRVHELGRDDTLGIEIEPEWASAHPRTAIGDSSLVRVAAVNPEQFQILRRDKLGCQEAYRPNAVVTSPDYGNRMSDQYLGTPIEQERREVSGEMPRRRGYAISLGRKVSPGSTAGLKFGPKYKAGHREIFTAVTNVCLPDSKLALNVSDFFVTNARGEDPQRAHVVSFWVELIASLGWVVERLIPVGTRRFRDGANSDLRVDAETVVVATLKGST
jgi:hypothetical protein